MNSKLVAAVLLASAVAVPLLATDANAGAIAEENKRAGVPWGWPFSHDGTARASGQVDVYPAQWCFDSSEEQSGGSAMGSGGNADTAGSGSGCAMGWSGGFAPFAPLIGLLELLALIRATLRRRSRTRPISDEESR